MYIVQLQQLTLGKDHENRSFNFSMERIKRANKCNLLVLPVLSVE